MKLLVPSDTLTIVVPSVMSIQEYSVSLQNVSLQGGQPSGLSPQIPMGKNH